MFCIPTFSLKKLGAFASSQAFWCGHFFILVLSRRVISLRGIIIFLMTVSVKYLFIWICTIHTFFFVGCEVISFVRVLNG